MKDKSPLYTIHASKIKTFLSLFSLTIFQIGGFFYVMNAPSYSLIVIAMFFVLLSSFFIEIVLLIHVIKYGLPKVEFYENDCFIQMYTLNINIRYDNIHALSLNKEQQVYKLIPYGYDYQLMLYLRDQHDEQNLFQKKIKQVKEFLIASQYVFLDRQVLELSIIFYAICSKSPENRKQTLRNLQTNHIKFDDLISSKDFKNFKNNQYLSKYF